MQNYKYTAQDFKVGLKEFLMFWEKRGFIINQVLLRNYKRYALIKGKLKGKQHNIFVLFKREPFYTFGFKFKHKGESGIGETINSNYLRKCMKERSKIKEINVIYDDGKYYSIKPELWAFHGYKHKLGFENKEVYSINIKHLERLN